LIDPLLQVKHEQKAAQRSFTKATFDAVVPEVKAHSKQAHLVDGSRCKNKHNMMKRDWHSWDKLIKNSGFDWDEEKGVPTADLAVWKQWFEDTNNNARKFRGRNS
jgi:hypothetical protein